MLIYEDNIMSCGKLHKAIELKNNEQYTGHGCNTCELKHKAACLEACCTPQERRDGKYVVFKQVRK